jgi:hypothetical protein
MLSASRLYNVENTMINKYGAVGVMRIDGGSWRTRRKPTPMPLCPTQIPHELTWGRNQPAAVRSRRLPAWAVAPHSCGYEEFYLLGNNALQSGESQPPFRRNIVHLSSGSKSKASKKQHEAGSNQSHPDLTYVGSKLAQAVTCTGEGWGCSLEFPPGRRLCWQTFFIAFLSPYRQMPESTQNWATVALLHICSNSLRGFHFYLNRLLERFFAPINISGHMLETEQTYKVSDFNQNWNVKSIILWDMTSCIKFCYKPRLGCDIFLRKLGC